MSKNWIAVNVLLLVIAGFMGRQLYISAMRFKTENDVAKVQPAANIKQQMTRDAGMAPLQPPRVYNTGDFAVIPDKNLFSDSRTRDDQVEAPVVPEVPPLQNKPILTGITISGNQRQAIIIDPTAPVSPGRRNITLIKRPGDVYQGYVITDITESQMILESGTRREIIDLYEGTKHSAQGGKTPILATRVVSFGGGGGGTGQASMMVVSSGGGARPSPQQGGAAPAVPIGSQRTVSSVPAQQQGQQQPVQSQFQQQQSRPLNPGETINSQGQRVIRTPFGDIIQQPTRPVQQPTRPPSD